jgi:voltage-gated potassium channel
MVVDLDAKEAEWMSATNKDLPRAQRQRGITLGLLRALEVTAVLIALYYRAPLDQLAGASLLVSMIIGLVALAAMTGYQVSAILRAAQPGVRALEALATTVPLFLLLFSATYFLMSHISTNDFNVHTLTRTDSLYFTVTVFATVGFGDISPASQMARLVVTAQMILNLIVLGLGVRLIVGAARQARQDNPDGRNLAEP